MRSLFLAAALATGAAPVSAMQTASAYLQQTVEVLKSTLNDPYSLRQVERTAPFGVRGWGEEAVVCVRFNAKNGLGGYVGLETYRVVFYKDGVAQFQEISNSCVGRTDWQPFPEIGPAD